MALMRWRPFEELMSIQEEINRIFDNFFSRFPQKVEVGRGAWSPSVDISETEDEVVVTAELPGMSKEDIKISLQDNVLYLKGEKKQEKESKGKNFHRIERRYGSFQRAFSLPVAVITDKIKANYRNGVLTIRLPKAEEAKPKEIPVVVE